MNFSAIPDNCFISHSYKDIDALEKLLKKLPARIKPTIFNSITVTADEMVSSALIKSLLDCDGLIYLEGGKSDDSFWVAFERNYALLARKAVFSFNIASEELRVDNSPAKKPPVYASYRC